MLLTWMLRYLLKFLVNLIICFYHGGRSKGFRRVTVSIYNILGLSDMTLMGER